MRHHKRGSAAVLAMLFLVIFAALGVAFYGMVTTSVAVTSNEKKVSLADGAIQSGMEYTKHLLSSIKFDTTDTSHGTDTMSRLCGSLNAKYGATSAIGQLSVTSGTVRIPAAGEIQLSAAQPGRFHAVVKMAPSASEADPKLLVTVYADNGSASATQDLLTRQVAFACAKADTSSAGISPLDYGVISKGPITMKNGVMVDDDQTNPSSSVDNLMLSASTAASTIVVESTNSSTVGNIKGKVYVTSAASQVSSEIRSKAQVLNKPVVFPDYARMVPDYANDPSFKKYSTWAAYLSDPTAGNKKRVYIENGDSTGSVTLGEQTYNQSLVFGPNVTRIVIDGKKEGKDGKKELRPSIIKGDPSFGYAIIAPWAQMVYNGNTQMDATGYVVVDKYGDNSNNSTYINITNGGMMTLATGSDACSLGQSDIHVKLPPKADRPAVAASTTYRSFQMDASTYTELAP